jgi:Na+-translocating ferredoxin:NAD+ oxidoreductase subunit B
MFQVALVAEAQCIGCTACFQACPTGAIVGAAKQLHTAIPELCTGCNACVPVCPVPCITLQTWEGTSHPLQGANAAKAKSVITSHATRLAQRSARAQAVVQAKPLAQGFALPPELAELAAAAREKSVQKYKKMGPLARPRALKK